MQHKYVTPKKWPPVVFALADEDAFAYCDKNPCVQCTFRCKREFEIYAYVENIGMVVKHLDEWVAPGSASTDDFSGNTDAALYALMAIPSRRTTSQLTTA